MTRYWPLSVIAHSPLLHHVHTWELMCAYHAKSLTESAMHASHQVAAETASFDTSLVVIHSEDAPMRRVYLAYPSFDDWARLERGGFIATADTFGLVIDALH